MAIEEEEGGGGSQCFKGYAMLRNDVRGERICNDVELLSIDVFLTRVPFGMIVISPGRTIPLSMLDPGNT